MLALLFQEKIPVDPIEEVTLALTFENCPPDQFSIYTKKVNKEFTTCDKSSVSLGN